MTIEVVVKARVEIHILELFQLFLFFLLLSDKALCQINEVVNDHIIVCVRNDIAIQVFQFNGRFHFHHLIENQTFQLIESVLTNVLMS